MSATIIILPVIPRTNYEPAAREQYDREAAADCCAGAPHRTRPLLVINNDRDYRRTLLRLDAALNDDH